MNFVRSFSLDLFNKNFEGNPVGALLEVEKFQIYKNFISAKYKN